MPSSDMSLYEQIIKGGDATRGIGYTLLERILGSDVMDLWVQSNGSTAAYASPIAAGMKISTTVAMIFLPLMGLYIVVTGLLKQERSGQSWNWKSMPLRMGLGAAFTAPVTPTGMSLVQAMVVALALIGNSLGNMAGDLLASKIYSPEVSTQTTMASDGKSAQAAFQSITAKAVCYQSAQAAGLGQGSDQQGSGTNEVENLCGQMLISSGSQLGSMQGVTAGNVSSNYTLDCSQSKYPSTCQKLVQINADFQQRFSAAISGGSVSDDDLQKMAADYQSAVSQVFGSTQNDLKTGAIQAVHQLGWLGLGNFWSQFSKASAELDQYVYASSETNFRLDQIPQTSDSYRSVYDSTGIAFDKARIAAQNMAGSFGNGNWGDALSNAGSAVGSGVATIGNAGVNTITLATNGIGYAGNSILRGTMFGFTGGQNDAFAVPAMDSLNRLGILLSVAGQVFDGVSDATKREDAGVVKTTLSVGKAGLSLATGNPMPAIKEALKQAANTLMESGSLMLHMATFVINAAAAFHLIVLPMLPNLFSLIMAGEWVMWVVVALVAGPLWGVMHVMPSGQDEVIHPRTFHGWGLMGFIALYPVIVVIGYGASIMLFNVLIPLAGYILTSYMPDGMVNSAMYMVFGLPIIGFMLAMIAWLTLSLILQLPGMIAGWIGIRPESWFTQQATNHMAGMVPSGNVAQAAGVLSKSRRYDGGANSPKGNAITVGDRFKN